MQSILLVVIILILIAAGGLVIGLGWMCKTMINEILEHAGGSGISFLSIMMSLALVVTLLIYYIWLTLISAS